MGDFRWPDGKLFAFTIVDDTDFSSVRSTKPIYDLLTDCGIVTTKTIWPLRPAKRGFTGGATLEDPEYRAWVGELQTKGVEIALHGVADGSSPREKIALGLARFRSVIGRDPEIHTNHVAQEEAIYWGAWRLDPPLDWIYRRYRFLRPVREYDGVVPSSPHFWGDLCQKTIRFVRNLVFDEINTLKVDPLMPYHDTRRPFVQYWFSASNGGNPDALCRLLSEANQDRLVEEGGACVVYAHLGSGLNPVPAEFRRLVKRLSRLPGWFVPATPLLNYVGSQRGWSVVSKDRSPLMQMQWRWALERTIHTLGKLPHPTTSAVRNPQFQQPAANTRAVTECSSPPPPPLPYRRSCESTPVYPPEPRS